MVETTYTVTEAEFCEAQIMATRFRDPNQNYKRWFYAAIIAAIQISILVSLVRTILHCRSLDVPYSFLVGIVLFLQASLAAYLGYLVFSLVRSMDVQKLLKRHYQHNLPGQTDVRLRMDESGWHDETPASGSTFLPWTRIPDFA